MKFECYELYSNSGKTHFGTECSLRISIEEFQNLHQQFSLDEKILKSIEWQIGRCTIKEGIIIFRRTKGTEGNTRRCVCEQEVDTIEDVEDLYKEDAKNILKEFIESVSSLILFEKLPKNIQDVALLRGSSKESFQKLLLILNEVVPDTRVPVLIEYIKGGLASVKLKGDFKKHLIVPKEFSQMKSSLGTIDIGLIFMNKWIHE